MRGPALDEKNYADGGSTFWLLCAVSSSLLGNQAESFYPRSNNENPLEVVAANLACDLGTLQGQLVVQKHDPEAQKLRIAELEGKCWYL